MGNGNFVRREVSFILNKGLFIQCSLCEESQYILVTLKKEPLVGLPTLLLATVTGERGQEPEIRREQKDGHLL